MTDQEAFTGLRLDDRYRLDQPLAHGGLCVVYRGLDEMLNRRVAVKAVPPEHVPAYREALRATASLSHPAMVVECDAIAHEGWLFLVQEYVDGAPLAAKIALGLSEADALHLALQLARVLAYAHKHQVSHGDLAPAAVLVERGSTIRLNNFALPPDEAYFAGSAEVERLLTRATTIPLPPSPSAEPTATPFAEDVRAVGLLLWQTLASAGPTGERRQFRADVPAEVRHLVARLVVRSHPARLATAEDAIAALEEQARNVSSRETEEEQPTPLPIRAARAAMDEEPTWSTEDTLASGGPWSGAPATAPPYPGPSPRQTRILGQPYDAPPARPGTPSGPLRAPVPSGPLRAPPRTGGPSGPLRTGGPSGPLRTGGPSGPLRTGGPTGPSRPYGSPTLPQPYRPSSQPLGYPSGAPPIPWRDDPAVARWAASPPRASGGVGALKSRLSLARDPGGIGALPVVVVGVVLFIICFVVGFLMPLVLPLR